MANDLDIFGGEGDLIPDSQRPSRRPTAPGGEVDDDNGRLSRASAAAIPLPDGGRRSAVTLPSPAPAPDFQDEGADSVVAPNKPAAKPRSMTIDIRDIRSPEAIKAYQLEIARLAAEDAAGNRPTLSASTPLPADVPSTASVRSSRANSVASSWAGSLPPRESKFARNLIAGGVIALAAVGGVGAWISIGSSAADSTPTAVAAATSAQASAVLDAGIAVPAPATSASAKTLNASVNGKNK